MKMAPKKSTEQFLAEKLQSYGYITQKSPLDAGLKHPRRYAANWVADFEESKKTLSS
jgi:hypothetical protein